MPEVSVLVEGGKASPAAPLGPALGPLGVNIGEVVARINEKTKGFAGMKVPVTVNVNADKSFDIRVGSPPASALIRKEANAKKGAGNPKTETVGNLSLEQLKKITLMKLDNLNAHDVKAGACIIASTCNQMGVTVEGKKASMVIQEIKEGKHDLIFQQA